MSRTWPALVYYDADLDRATIQYEDGHLVYDFQFQHGPPQENGRNGLMNEELVEVLILRLRALNTRFPCRENSIAVTHFEEALMWLEKRQELRVAQGVYGKNEAHKS